MSVSIYYTVKRKHPLTNEENLSIQKIISNNDVKEELEHYLKTGQGYNWESFTIYPKDESGETIFEGSTKLPDNSEDAITVGLEHWLNTLTQIRRAIPDTVWYVHLDDLDIPWNSDSQSFDLTLI